MKKANESNGTIGIGGIGNYTQNEAPHQPTAEEIESQVRETRKALRCRRCGCSELSGAMFTTLGSSGVCDDCL